MRPSGEPFGKVRQAGGRSTNPNVKMMKVATDALCLQASAALDVVRSDSHLKEHLFQEIVLDSTETVPLAKRRQVRAKTPHDHDNCNRSHLCTMSCACLYVCACMWPLCKR